MIQAAENATILSGILAFVWTDYFWKLYLAMRQYRTTAGTTMVPKDLSVIVKQDTFDQARQYSLKKQKFGMATDLFETLVTTAVLNFGLLAKLWQFSQAVSGTHNEIIVSCLWSFIVVSLSTLIYMPLNMYYTFVLEDNFGFNKQTPGFFVKDELKAFTLSQLIYLPVVVSSTAIVLNTGNYFFVWLWLAIGTMYLTLMALYPFYIAPLFDDFTPLADGELRSEIEELATQLKFPLTQIYIVNESKRSTHSNAYYAGLFRTKRIVIYDNLLQSTKTGGCKTDEVLAVLTHELGHWKLGHLTQKSILAQINLFITSAVFQAVYFSPAVYQAFGFYKSMPVVPGLLFTVQYMIPYNTIVSLLKHYLFDKMEQQADEFGPQLGRTDALIRALVKTHTDNLDFPVYDNLYCSWYHSHSTLLERIAALESKPTS